jgi:hypothetical protein
MLDVVVHVLLIVCFVVDIVVIKDANARVLVNLHSIVATLAEVVHLVFGV